MIQFESLPNELLLNLFEYFKTIELFQIFYDLNSRFNILLYNYYRNYHLDFRFISKHDFLLFSDHHLPQIINHIVSLRIGDEYETPGLPNMFHFLGYSLREFIHLQYLSLHDIELSIFIEYFNDISQLNNLISLTITNCNISFYETKEMNFFNQIWLLPKLKYFHINTDYLKYINNFQINHHSSTLEHIYIHTSCEFSYYNLINIIEYTSNLQYISMSIEALNKYEILTFNLSSIKNLKLKYRGETNILKNLLQNTPNLQELHIRMMNTYLTGHEWKEIIKNYLPCLKILNFQICIRYLPNENVKIPYDEFLNTFRTSFWLDEHQWYICSDKYPDGFIIFYTLPSYFSETTSMIVLQQKSTCPLEKKQWLLNKIKRLHCSSYNDKYPYEISTYFSNINDLNIDLPLTNRTWNSILTFNYLTSLTVHIGRGKDESFDLQRILNQSFHLYSLTIYELIKKEYSIIFQLISSSIRRLKFQTNNLYPCYFNKDDCILFTQSSLGKQCEVLFISLEDLQCVEYLMNMLNKLRTITIKINYNSYLKEYSIQNQQIDLINQQLQKLFQEYQNLWTYSN